MINNLVPEIIQIPLLNSKDLMNNFLYGKIYDIFLIIQFSLQLIDSFM